MAIIRYRFPHQLMTEKTKSCGLKNVTEMFPSLNDQGVRKLWVFKKKKLLNFVLPCVQLDFSSSLICCLVAISSLSSNTYQIIQENTDQYWCFQRYRLIYEYYTRPTLAPPLILISHLVLFVRWIIGKCSLCLSSQHSDLSKCNIHQIHTLHFLFSCK